MRYLKILGLALGAAGAVVAFAGAGAASATELTCTNPPGTKVMCTTTIHATTMTVVTLDLPTGNFQCHSTFHVLSQSTGGATSTPSGEDVISFTECPETVSVLRNGTLEIHTEGSTANHNGLVTTSGLEFTIEGFGFHCIFTTNSTTLGTLTGSSTTGGKATLDISATIPRTGGRSGGFCGSSAPMTGTYQIEAPEWLDVD